MAKRRTVPLFDLLTRPDPNAGVQAANVPAPQASPAPAAQGMPAQRPVGMPKPIVRLAVPTASQADADPASDNVESDGGGSTDTSTAAPAIQVEAKPKFAPREAAHRFVGTTSTIQAAPPPATIAASEAAEQWAGRELRVPKLGLYIVLFLIGCGALVVWGVAYKLGFTSGKQSTEELVRRDPPAVVEPGPQEPSKSDTTKGLGNLGLVSPQPMTAPTPKEPPRVLSKPAPSGADDIKMPAELGPGRYDNPGTWTDTLTTSGWAVADPRVSGLNYLWLGNMPRQDAGEAVEFLGLNGVEAFATPVENSARGAKDSDPVQTYRVWAGPGLSGADLRSNKDEPLEKRIERLGQFWSTQAKKRYDFRKPQWVKYEAK